MTFYFEKLDAAFFLLLVLQISINFPDICRARLIFTSGIPRIFPEYFQSGKSGKSRIFLQKSPLE
jgi:hypothetical protein